MRTTPCCYTGLAAANSHQASGFADCQESADEILGFALIGLPVGSECVFWRCVIGVGSPSTGRAVASALVRRIGAARCPGFVPRWPSPCAFALSKASGPRANPWALRDGCMRS
jgi:hypothetical protein